MTNEATTKTETKSTKVTASEKARLAILQECLENVPFEGWTECVLSQSVVKAGYPKGAEGLYFPGGILEVIRFWSKECDQQAVQALAQLDLKSLKIRERVTQGVLARLKAIGPHETSAKRALSRLLLPDALGQGPAQIWASADMIWRAIGDTSTDMNYYSKRTILSGVIGSSLLSWLGDHSTDKQTAKQFVDARIENVMQFEKAKLQVKKRTENWVNPVEALGRLRYGTRPRRRRRH